MLYSSVHWHCCSDLMIGHKIFWFFLNGILLPRMTWEIPGCAQILMAVGQV